MERAAQRRWGFSVGCGTLGWILDAYDFFVLVFLYDTLAARFAVSKAAIIATITITLFMRPLGALLLGAISDRWGRRTPLIACVLYFSVITALTPFAPTYTVFVIMRGLYGIGMGGYWGVGAAIRENWQLFLMLTLFMTVITCLSHGTQDLYPDFLKIVHGFSGARVADTAILYNLGAILGAVVIGRLSDRFGRKNCIYAALAVCVIALPAWAFGSTLAVLLAGSFLMQVGVQGAFGVVPAYLNELSPPQTRSLFPGLVYQLGVLLGAPCVNVEYALRNHLGYPRALAVFECGVFLVLGLVLLRAREQHGRSFTSG